MKTLGKIIGWTIAAVMFIVLLWIAAGCYLVFYKLPRTDVKAMIEETVNDNLNARTTFSRIGFTFFASFPDVSLDITDFCMKDTVTADTLLSIRRARVKFSAIGLMERRLSVKDIEIDAPYANFRVDSTGGNNFSGILKPQESQADTTDLLPDVLNFNEVAVNDARIKYSNYTTDLDFDINRINFSISGRLNTKDTTLDIRYGRIYIKDNGIDFNGYLTTESVDFSFSHGAKKLEGVLPEICRSIDKETAKKLNKADIGGRTHGECRLYGPLNDSLHGLSIAGKLNINDLSFISTKGKHIIKKGDISLRYRYIVGDMDSSFIAVDTMILSGPNISCNLHGNLTSRKDRLWVDAALKAKANCTNIIRETSLLPKGMTLQGNLSADIRTKSSVYDLMHKYRFPESISSLKDLDIRIVLPNITGKLGLTGLKFTNSELAAAADTLNMALEGKKSCLDAEFINLKLDHNDETENALLEIHKGDIAVDGDKLIADIDVDRVGCIDILHAEKDTVTLSAEAININVAAKGKDFATGTIDELSYSYKGQNALAARINIDLNNEDPAGDKLWDACKLGSVLVKYSNKDLSTFCKVLKGSFRYDGNISGLAVQSDSIGISAGGNELLAKDISIVSPKEENYTLTIGNTEARKTVLGIGIGISYVRASYDDRTKLIALNTGRVLLGKSDIYASGTVSLAGKNPKVKALLNGNHLDLDEIMYATNVAALANGDPAAVPLDSIPENTIPRTVAADGTDVSLALDLKGLRLSGMSFPNAKGDIIMDGKSTLIRDLKSGSICMNTRFTYKDPDHSDTDVILEFKKFDVTDLGNLIPGIDTVSPMISALRGTLDLKLVMHSPVRHIIAIDIANSEVGAALQARDLSISDNEQFREIAKTLMFKNKESTHIDSLAVAAKISDKKLTVLPFMLKIDRYKVAVGGWNDIATGEMDYHISILKSPVPFKFGLNYKGVGKDSKMKLVKTEYKKLDPSIKPWTDPGFVQFIDRLEKPVKNFPAL